MKEKSLATHLNNMNKDEETMFKNWLKSKERYSVKMSVSNIVMLEALRDIRDMANFAKTKNVLDRANETIACVIKELGLK